MQEKPEGVDYRYSYRVGWNDGDNLFVGTCEELPSLSYLAETPEQALTGIRHVVKDAIDVLLEDGCELSAETRQAICQFDSETTSGQYSMYFPFEPNEDRDAWEKWINEHYDFDIEKPEPGGDDRRMCLSKKAAK